MADLPSEPTDLTEAAKHAQAILHAIHCEGLQEWWGSDSGRMDDLNAARAFLLALATPTPTGPPFCNRCDGYGVTLPTGSGITIVCPDCGGNTASRPERGPGRPTPTGGERDGLLGASTEHREIVPEINDHTPPPAPVPVEPERTHTRRPEACDHFLDDQQCWPYDDPTDTSGMCDNCGWPLVAHVNDHTPPPAPVPVEEREGRRWFVYDGEDFDATYKSEGDAAAAATSAIEQWREICDTTWPEETGSVCMGPVTHRAAYVKGGNRDMSEVDPLPYDNPDGEWGNFVLSPLAALSSPPTAPGDGPVRSDLSELWDRLVGAIDNNGIYITAYRAAVTDAAVALVRVARRSPAPGDGREELRALAEAADRWSAAERSSDEEHDAAIDMFTVARRLAPARRSPAPEAGS